MEAEIYFLRWWILILYYNAVHFDEILELNPLNTELNPICQ